MWVILGPNADIFVEVMRSENRRIPREIIKVVHDDGDKEIEHEERAEKVEGDEEEVGEEIAAFIKTAFLTRPARSAVQHDELPGLACGTATEK